MRRISLLMSLSLFVLAGSAVPLFGWNDLGHMTVARIAYLRLTDAERAASISILHHHPHLQELLLKDCPAHADQGEWLFVNAATWPDRIRPPAFSSREPTKAHAVYRFHHPTWHYANREFDPGRAMSQARHPASKHPVSGHPQEQTDIVEQLDQSFQIVQGSGYERSEPEVELDAAEVRAIRLCWLMHLMGDIHQPLHVISFVDERVVGLQHGDEGGNKLGVRLNHSAAPKKLHAIWDDILGTHPQFNKVVQLADMIYRDPRTSVNQLPEYTRHKMTYEFADESYQIARDSIYMNGRLHYALWSRIESHELAPVDVPVLPQQVIDQAHSLAQRQILLAGCRLADRMKLAVSRDVNLRDRGDLALPPSPGFRHPGYVR